MTRTLTTSTEPGGNIRISLNEDGKERFHARCSPMFATTAVDDIKYHWEQTGQKPYGFITKDTKAL